MTWSLNMRPWITKISWIFGGWSHTFLYSMAKHAHGAAVGRSYTKKLQANSGTRKGSQLCQKLPNELNFNDGQRSLQLHTVEVGCVMLNIVHYLESYTIHVWYIISIYIYLLTFTITKQPNAGKYTSQMDGMGLCLKPYPGTHIFQTSSSGIDSTVASHKLRHSCTKLSKESSGSGAACSQANTKTWPSPGNRNFPWPWDHGKRINSLWGFNLKDGKVSRQEITYFWKVETTNDW